MRSSRSPGSTAACSGASTARACARSSRRSFFGPLYPTLQAIKAAFDPRNQFNPGKIATPGEGGLLTIDGVPIGASATAPSRPTSGPASTRRCTATATAPATIGTPTMPCARPGRRRASGAIRPRAGPADAGMAAPACGAGRSIRSRRAGGCAAPRRGAPCRPASATAWARRRGEPDFSHEVKEAMDGCLACKSCVGQCPIKVDVPTFRSKFLELYYGRYLAPD